MHSQLDLGPDHPGRADTAARPAAGTATADPAVDSAALARRLTDSRRTVDISMLLLLASFLVGAMLIAGQPTWTFGAAVIVGLLLVLTAFAAFLVINGRDWRVRRDLVPLRLALAEGAEPEPVALRALPWRSSRALIGAFLPLAFVALLIWRLRVEQATLDEVLPGQRINLKDVLAWGLTFGLVLIVPAVAMLLVYRRYRVGTHSVLARVDADGIWLRAMRVTVPWSEVVSLGLRLDDRPETGLLIEVADPEEIVARSEYRGLRRRYALWTLRGGDRFLMIDEFWLAEPVDRALAAALAYHREAWADSDYDGAEPVQRAELTGWVF
ncbi:hypothetical protein Cs7R123_72520 [Catellatospora sp. TT07R-123]|nr:hypothetical protein Cs7R123_72520 [Catellatospora sp. TT07R-123]